MPERTCSCDRFLERKACEHSDIVDQIYLRKDYRFIWTLISATHKELRRSDPLRALMWAKQYARLSTPKRVAEYVQSVLFEESRNLSLYSKYKLKELTWDDQITLAARSRKKWERVSSPEHFEWWMRSWETYRQTKDRWTLTSMKERIRSFQDMIQANEILFFLRDHKDLKPVFWEEIAARAERERNQRLLWLLRFNPTSYYERQVALELTLGSYEQGLDDLHPQADSSEEFIPALRSYTFDVHTALGSSLLLKYWTDLYENKLPPGCPLDLRWSGQVGSVLWRSLAFSQYGAMKRDDGTDLRWEEVQIPGNLWTRALHFESAWYVRFFAKLKKRGLWK